ncbi:hypothetical protein FQN60_005869 [Etheostoma spectabile]|uniref:Uncharacterized protein n=1 Tax=Etheostoma spectabile TaxID=54343 RepID=A0A5J5CEG7_9PERO|nr:hypothetical protein FQN60_005869 [Etheostoma spectabile]
MIVAAHVFEASITQIMSPVNFREAVQVHAVVQPDLRGEELEDGGDLTSSRPGTLSPCSCTESSVDSLIPELYSARK